MGAVLVYRPATGEVVTRNLGGPVDDLAFAPSGSRAFIVRETNQISAPTIAQIVNLGNGARMTVRPPASLRATGWSLSARSCWTPDGSEIVTWNPDEAVDPVLRVFSPVTGAELFERGGATYNAAACGATARGPYVAAGDDGGAGTLVQDFAPDPQSSRQFTVIGLYGHTQLISSVATSPAGDTIATGSDDGSVRIWDATSGHQLSLIEGNGRPIESVQFSPDGGAILAVAANGVVLVADAGTGEPDTPLQAPGTGRTYALGFAAGSRLVYGIHEATQAARNAGELKITRMTALLWRADDGRLVASDLLPAPPAIGQMACPAALRFETFCDIVAPAREFTGFTVSPDGRYLAYATPSGIVARPFARGAAAHLTLTRPVTGLTFAGAADDVVVMTNQIVDVWHPFGDQRLTSLPQPSPPIDAELSGDDDQLATANAGGSATIWDLPSGRPLARFRPHRAHGNVVPPVPVRVALSASGTYLAVGTDLGAVDIWRVPGRRLIASRLVIGASTASPYPITELGLADGGHDVVAVNFPQNATGDAEPPGTAMIMETATGRVVTTLGSPGQVVPPVNPGVAVSPDGNYALGGTEGFAPLSAEAGSEAVYDLPGGQELVNLQNTQKQAPPDNPGAANMVPFSAWAADGIHLLTGGPAVYSCDSCGSLSQMQSAARLRLAWAVPLTTQHDHPPSGNAFS
jgi:WD40 repeat protein